MGVVMVVTPREYILIEGGRVREPEEIGESVDSRAESESEM